MSQPQFNVGFPLYHLPGQGEKKKQRGEDVDAQRRKLQEQLKDYKQQVRAN